MEAIFGDTDVYEAYPPADATILVRGLVLAGMTPDAPAATYRKPRSTDKQEQAVNDPPMAIAWTRLHRNESGTTNRILTTTMGSATDLENEGLRRLVVNGVYWGLGMDVPARADVTYVDEYAPSFYGFEGFRSGQAEVILPLLPASLRVIVPDQRGHGRSDRAPDGYSMDAMARDVVELMDALNVPTATVVGHSMGSFVARRAASLAPERISRLVLVGAGPVTTTKVFDELQVAVNALQDPVDRTFVREFQYSTVHQPVPPAFMDRAIAESLTLDASTWKALMQGMLGYAPAEAEIAAPTLVLGGDRDGVFSADEQRALGEQIRGAKVQILTGVGHTPHWEVPDTFVAELLRFLGVRS